VAWHSGLMPCVTSTVLYAGSS